MHEKRLQPLIQMVDSNAATSVLETNLDQKPWVRPPGVDDEGWKYLTLTRKILLTENQPVEFYARVLDQDGKAVAQARLDLDLSLVNIEKMLAEYPHMNMGSEITNHQFMIYSDTNGWLQFVGAKGRVLNIKNLTKDGYVWQRPQGMGSPVFDPGGKRNVTGTVDLYDSFNRAKGYTFNLWKKGETERVLPIEVGVNMDFEIKGQWVSNYFVSFIPARVEWTNFAGTDLVIQGIRRSSGNADRPYEFTFKLSVPSGGILLSDHVYAYHAPETGYQPFWSFENQPQKNPPDYPWLKTAYLKLRGGKLYAGVQLGFCNGGFNFSFNGHLNPTGSRNLEPDPEKLITDPSEIQKLDEATRPK